MKKIIYTTLAAIFVLSAAVSCDQPEELTPKTDSITVDYLLPKGSILTDEEYQEAKAIVKEHQEATK